MGKGAGMSWRDVTKTIPELRDQESAYVPADADADAGTAVDAAAAVDAAGEPEGSGARGTGSRLGRYVILYRLGSGGMGVVFAAYDPELDRKVALKLVRPETDSPAAREALRREAQSMARLSHPNIVAVHDVGSEDRDVFLAMDLIEGATLGEWLQLGERGWRDILRVFVQAGRGLAAAHAAGVVHQDFSPRNVLVTAAREARITDFGLARAQGQPGFETPDEVVRGTPAYLAPERLLGLAVDPRSDQFSFCAALYKALCGTLPFPADSPALYLERLKKKAFAPPLAGRRVPRRLLALLRRGLDAEPENRLATMPELLDRLERILRRPRLLLLAVSVAILLAAAILAFQGSRPEPAPDRLAGVWSGPQRQQVREAFLRADPGSGAAAAAQIEGEIDAYAVRWRAIDEDGYRIATRKTGIGAALLRDRQRLCLDARRAELQALLARLGAWKEPDLEPAITGVHGLSDLGSCADLRALEEMKAPALDAAARRAIVPLRAGLEEQFTLFETGGALNVDQVDRLVEKAGRLGHLPLLMRSHEIRAAIRNDRGLPGAQADLESALRAAVGSADRRGQVRIFALLAETIGLTEGRYADARLWRNLAEASLAALEPGHEELEIRVQRSLGAVALAEGDNLEARRRYERALALAEGLWGKESTRLPVILNDLAVAVRDSRMSTGLLRRALAIQERAYGPDSPLLMSPLTNLAGELAYAGSYRQALGLTRRTLRIQEAYYEPDFRDLAYPLFLSGQILIALDEPAEAVALLDRAMVLVRKGYGERHHLVGEMWCARAEAELAELRTDAAAGSVANCRSLVAGAVPPNHPVLITLRRLEGEVALARGQADRARTILAEAAGMPGASNLEAMQILAPRAEAELAAGDPAAARRAAEAGLALRNQDNDPALAGRLRLALALATVATVEDTEPERANALARQALGELISAGAGSPRTRALRTRAEAWLSRGSV